MQIGPSLILSLLYHIVLPVHSARICSLAMSITYWLQLLAQKRMGIDLKNKKRSKSLSCLNPLLLCRNPKMTKAGSPQVSRSVRIILQRPLEDICLILWRVCTVIILGIGKTDTAGIYELGSLYYTLLSWLLISLTDISLKIRHH